MSETEQIAKAKQLLLNSIFDPLCKKWDLQALGKFTIPANGLQAWCLTENAIHCLKTSTLSLGFVMAAFGPLITAICTIVLIIFVIFVGLVRYRKLGQEITHRRRINDTKSHYISSYSILKGKQDIEQILNNGITIQHIQDAINNQCQINLDKNLIRLQSIKASIQDAQNVQLTSSDLTRIEHELWVASRELEEAGIEEYQTH